jgi:NADPH2:quinone reductase
VRAIQINQFGGPEVLELVELPDPQPTDGFELIDVTAIGVNYADTHQTENSYLSTTTLPLVPGGEVAGRTSDGRRVAALLGTGGYAERALAAHGVCFDLPDEVSDAAALALLVQGLTAWHLLRTCARMQPGESVVVHAAAGGVGTLAVQLAKAWGAGRVIGTASTADKRKLASDLGADATVDAESTDLKQALKDANGGAKVDIVLEMVGGPTFDASLAALAPFGRLITFGMASRTPPTPIAPASLMIGSKSVMGFWLVDCLRNPSMLTDPMDELLTMTAKGQLTPQLGATYPLAAARQAHEDMRARRTTGKVVLVPDQRADTPDQRADTPVQPIHGTPAQ